MLPVAAEAYMRGAALDDTVVPTTCRIYGNEQHCTNARLRCIAAMNCPQREPYRKSFPCFECEASMGAQEWLTEQMVQIEADVP